VSQLPLEPAAASDAKLKLLLAYDGTDFRGFVAQPAVRTVEGVLTSALERMLPAPVSLSCAGRTDAGVHAWGQVVTCPAPVTLDPQRVQRSLNAQLGPEVVVRTAELVDRVFDARHSARARSYRYTIVNRDQPDPFLSRYAWWVPGSLDRTLLRLAADPFVGEHDFASFCRRGPVGSTTVRRVRSSTWCELGDGILRYDVTADAFCWQMVRSIVGTLVDAGRGKVRPGDVTGILARRDRAAAGVIAPAHGLCLWAVAH
jgi:tRNA pseudouridine38-40 synthase